MTFTHNDLVEAGAKWMTSNQRCRLVMKEYQSWMNAEQPDCIGFQPAGGSVLVECKVSRADFLRERGKTYRRAALNGDAVCGMGRYRYFLAPQGIIKPDDLTGILEGYGLLLPRRTSRGICISVLRASKAHSRDLEAENTLLVNVARRIVGYKNHIPEIPRAVPKKQKMTPREIIEWKPEPSHDIEPGANDGYCGSDAGGY